MRLTKRLFSALIVLAVMLGLTVTVFADGVSTLKYEDTVVTVTGDEARMYTATDLFTEFKNIMPGDVLRQSVTIENVHAETEKIWVNIHAKPHSDRWPLSDEVAAYGETPESVRDFLEQLRLTVSYRGEVIFEGTPYDLTTDRANFTFSRISDGHCQTLDLELTVPLDLPTEYSGRAGEVDWYFLIIEYDKDDIPITGDSFQLELYLCIMAVCASVLLAIYLGWRKRKAETGE